MATHVASVRVGVADDDVPLWIQRVRAVADEPLAGTAALHAVPLSAGERELVVLLEERPVGGERLAEGRPLVLLGALAVIRLRFAPALQASVVFTINSGYHAPPIAALF